MLELPKLSNMPFGLVTLSSPFNYDPGTEIISGDSLLHTENAVFTSDGRYFVAGEHSDPNLGWGIYEVVKTESVYGLKQVVAGILEVDSIQHECWFHGLTTDGTYLYATAVVHLEGDPHKSAASIESVKYGALFRILPVEGSPEVSIVHYQGSEIHPYNGMAVGPDGAIYMSNTPALRDGSNIAIYKVTILDAAEFEIRIEPWLSASLLRDIGPNGIQIKNDTMYYVSGKGLHKITIGPSGPGVPIPIYIPMIPNNGLDDLAILPDGRVAVGEIDLLMNFGGFEGWGINQIVTIDPSGVPLNNTVTLTSPYTVSSLVYAEGDLFTQDKLIATSWFHGGVREIGLP